MTLRSVGVLAVLSFSRISAWSAARRSGRERYPLIRRSRGSMSSEGGGEPALLLVRGAPVVHLVRPLPDERVDGLETVGGLQARPQGPEDAQAVEGEGLLEALVETRDGRLVQEPEFLTAPEEGGLGLGIARPLVGLLELPAPARPGGPSASRPPRSPACATGSVGRRPGRRRRVWHRFPEPLGPVDDAEEPVLVAESPLDQLPEERGTHGLVHDASLL